MSNPWSTTPYQLAIDPLHQLLHAFVDTEYPAPPSATSSTDAHDSPSHDVPSSSSGALQHSSPRKPFHSVFIRKLRDMDEYLLQQREYSFYEKALEVHPEVSQTAVLVNDLNRLYFRLMEHFELLAHPDVLHVCDPHHALVLDDISQENQIKLLSSLRSMLPIVVEMLAYSEDFDGKMKLEVAAMHNLVSSHLTNSDIMNERKSYEDYNLVVLYDILREATNAMDLMKKSLKPSKNGVNQTSQPNKV